MGSVQVLKSADEETESKEDNGDFDVIEEPNLVSRTEDLQISKKQSMRVSVEVKKSDPAGPKVFS